MACDGRAMAGNLILQMIPYLHFMPDRWVLIPTITVGHPKCECCDEGPVIVSLDWLCFSAGLEINPPENHPNP